MPQFSARLTLSLGISLVVGLLIVGILAVIWHAAQRFATGPQSANDIWHLLRMSAIQAGLSVILALIVGGVLALALSRLQFKAKPFIVALFSAGLVLPTILVAFGLLAIWGRAGVISGFYGLMGWGKLPFSIFGLHGILAAHTLLNGSFAARIFHDRLNALPLDSQKLGRSLGLDEWQRFIILDWPALRAAVPGLAVTIFLMCFTSFSVVLLLGGGPHNSTFEVAIFEAVRLDFDLHRAALLAASQLGFCLLIIVPATMLDNSGMMIDAPKPSAWPARGGAKFIASAILLALSLAYLSPILATIVKGADSQIFTYMTTPKFLAALKNSLIIAFASAILATLLAVCLAFGHAELVLSNLGKKHKKILQIFISAPVFAYLATPAIVLGLGFFLLARLALLDSSQAGIWVVILANALMTLPLANATLAPPMVKIANRYQKLMRSLKLSGWQRARWIELPLLRREIIYVFTIGFCFSLGDLSVIALFGTGDFTTLPWLMYQSLGAYRTNDAAMIGAIMLVLTIGFFYLFPKLFGHKNHA